MSTPFLDPTAPICASGKHPFHTEEEAARGARAARCADAGYPSGAEVALASLSYLQYTGH